MCFFYALSQTAKSLKNRYQLKLDFEFELLPEFNEPKYYVSGFDFPKMPVITNEQPDNIQGFTWGLVPSWVNSHNDAVEIRSNTLNARSDTVFTKPSFRNAIRKRRKVFMNGGNLTGKSIHIIFFLKIKTFFRLPGYGKSGPTLRQERS